MNSKPSCERLDDFLDGDLSGDDVATFESHLPTCETCAATVADWRFVALRLRAASGRETVPLGLAARIDGRLNVVRQRRIAAAVATGAALAASVWLFVHRAESPPNERPVAVVPEPAPLAVVRFPNDLLAMPVPSDAPNVTVFRVYPKLNTPSTDARRSLR